VAIFLFLIRRTLLAKPATLPVLETV